MKQIKRRKKVVKMVDSINCTFAEMLPSCCGMVELGGFGLENPFAKNPEGVVKYLRTPGDYDEWSGREKPGHMFGVNVTLYIMTNHANRMRGWVESLRKGGARIITDYRWTSKDHKSKLRTVMFR